MSVVIDVERARRETPGCRNVAHFNNAGASLPPQCVLDAQIEHLKLESQIGGYEAFRREIRRVERFYDAVARLLNCDAEEVAFTENATRAWDMAFYSIPFRQGDRILTAANEYASNYIAFLQVSARTGARVEVVPSDSNGCISIDALRSRMDDRVRLIALTHVATNGGMVQPAEEVGAVVRESGAVFLLDACQSAGQIPLDVKRLGCHMLSATGRKFLRGPRGTGFLYVRKDIAEKTEPILLDLHAAHWTAPDRYEVRSGTRRFENWEQNVAGKLGLVAAVDYAMQWDLAAIEARVSGLAESLRNGLASLPGVHVHDQGFRRCGIVTFTVDGCEPQVVRDQLSRKNINVSYTEAAGTLLDMQARGLAAVVRASVHYYNTEDELERLCQAVHDCTC